MDERNCHSHKKDKLIFSHYAFDRLKQIEGGGLRPARRVTGRIVGKVLTFPTLGQVTFLHINDQVALDGLRAYIAVVVLCLSYSKLDFHSEGNLNTAL